jgi:hypothetical protein
MGSVLAVHQDAYDVDCRYVQMDDSTTISSSVITYRETELTRTTTWFPISYEIGTTVLLYTESLTRRDFGHDESDTAI